MKTLLCSLLLLLPTLHAVAQKTVKVACVGNSITYGYLLPQRETEAYPAQLQLLLGNGYQVENFGKSGTTLLRRGHRPYMQQEEFRKALQFAADIVVIHLGVNDTDPRDWPNYRDDFVRDYLALIDSFRTVQPTARIIIAKLSPLTHRHFRFESGTRDWREEIQQAIETVAQVAHVQLTDFERPLLACPHLMPDAVHPDAEGARLLAQTVCSAITGDYGGLQMPVTYTDRMVLQRDRPLLVQGVANVGARVKVNIAGKKAEAVTDDNGHWEVTLDPLPAGGPYMLKISDGKTNLTYRDVLIGEVWLCSGQSNMEFMLKAATTAERDIAEAGDPQLRLFDMKARWLTYAVEWPASVLDSVNRLQYYKETAWQCATPETARDFSAIAYHFGKVLRDSLQVPVGLLCNAVGGSPTEAWIDRRTLGHQFPAILRNWTKNDFIQEWVRERAAQNVNKSSYDGQRHPYEPCYLFEAGIQPLAAFPIKGVIWYQGESNAHNTAAHEKLFRLLVKSWRENWDAPQLPFYYVQLSSIDRPSWPWFRDSQRRLMNDIPATGMAVSSDCGDSLDVHPRHKQPIGERLARWALCKSYGYDRLVPSGPLFRSAEFRDGAAYLTFDYGEGLHSSDGEPLRTFEVAEHDGLFLPAVAEVVEGNRLKVYSPQVPHPRFVRYAWQPFTRANLVNAVGLPASTFRTE